MYEPKDLPKVTAFSVQVAEVEVDRATGAVQVKRLTTAHDTGVVLNRSTLQGQIDGGAVNGFGFTVMEENMIVDGKIATLNMGDAKLPCIADIPALTTVLLETPTGPTPFAGKAIAEMPNVPTAAAIANAIADATGVRIYDLPITAEKVYRALQEQKDARP
jgi:CO/xanthine dehydrogenase Mo-binding subunit